MNIEKQINEALIPLQDTLRTKLKKRRIHSAIRDMAAGLEDIAQKNFYQEGEIFPGNAIRKLLEKTLDDYDFFSDRDKDEFFKEIKKQFGEEDE